MLEIVQNQLKDQLKSADHPHFLLACSGGVDSMVLFNLLLKLDHSFTVAHCNFQLRGKESDGDQDFVKTYCESNAIPFVTKSFSTKTFHIERGVSIQMAARELRYDWFNALMKTGPYTHLLTAHHLDDQIETFLINLPRLGLKRLEWHADRSRVAPFTFGDKGGDIDLWKKRKSNGEKMPPTQVMIIYGIN